MGNESQIAFQHSCAFRLNDLVDWIRWGVDTALNRLLRLVDIVLELAQLVEDGCVAERTGSANLARSRRSLFEQEPMCRFRIRLSRTDRP